MQPETSVCFICSVYPPLSSPSQLFPKVGAVCAAIGTHVQVTEVLVVVQSVAHHKAVGDFKSHICQEKRQKYAYRAPGNCKCVSKAAGKKGYGVILYYSTYSP